MPNKKPVELCLSQIKKETNKFVLLLYAILGVVQLITPLLNVIDKLYCAVSKFL